MGKTNEEIIGNFNTDCINLFLGCLDSNINQKLTLSRDFRQDMRDFVINISDYSRGINPDFITIPQNGHELLTVNGDSKGPLSQAYLNAINGVGREDPFL